MATKSKLDIAKLQKQFDEILNNLTKQSVLSWLEQIVADIEKNINEKVLNKNKIDNYVNTTLSESESLCRWMPIDGRLPERGEKVLVLFGAIDSVMMGRRMNDVDGNDVWTVFFSDGLKPNFGVNAEVITHWMLLPKAI